MIKKYQNRYKHLLKLYKKYLSERGFVVEAIDLLEKSPEIIDIFVGELNAAIYLFARFQAEEDILDEGSLSLINAEKLKSILENDRSLPDCRKVLEKIESTSYSKLAKETFQELKQFEFLDSLQSPKQLISALFVALYRTFLLNKYPKLRDSGAQVASTIEEMLAVLALKGFPTHLFQATKHWIADWKAEGFSKELAKKIASL